MNIKPRKTNPQTASSLCVTLNRIGFKDFNGREKKVCDISHHAAQETDGARRRDVARRACGSNAGHENGRVAKPERTGTPISLNSLPPILPVCTFRVTLNN